MPEIRPFLLEIIHDGRDVFRLQILGPIGTGEARYVFAAVRIDRRGPFAEQLQLRRLQFVQRTQRTHRRAAVPQAARRKALAHAGVEARLAGASSPQPA